MHRRFTYLANGNMKYSYRFFIDHIGYIYGLSGDKMQVLQLNALCTYLTTTLFDVSHWHLGRMPCVAATIATVNFRLSYCIIAAELPILIFHVRTTKVDIINNW